MRLTGTWHGEYTYGEQYEELAGYSVPWRISITERGLLAFLARSRIVGTVRDDASKGGMPELGTIDGRRRGRSVQFVKTMPHHYLPEPDGSLVDMAKVYREQYGIELPGKLPPHVIHYAGHLDDSGERITGTWVIRPWLIPHEDSYLQTEESRGTWSAHKHSPLTTEL